LTYPIGCFGNATSQETIAICNEIIVARSRSADSSNAIAHLPIRFLSCEKHSITKWRTDTLAGRVIMCARRKSMKSRDSVQRMRSRREGHAGVLTRSI